MFIIIPHHTVLRSDLNHKFNNDYSADKDGVIVVFPQRVTMEYGPQYQRL